MTALRLLGLLLAITVALAARPAVAQAPDEFTLPGAEDATEEPAELPALLVADSIVVTPDNQLIADGNVEIMYDGRNLQASRVIYDQATDTVRLIGPLRSTAADGAVVLASEAEIDAGLRNGILRGARVVLDRQLQLAAVQMARVEGRYSVLSRASLTSCQICANGKPPLWEIRARRVVHDEVERKIYLDEAQFRVLDVPVAYLPTVRLPDPTVERERGFLFPIFRSTNQLGPGLKLPYFIPLGPHRDLLLTPYVSPETATLEYRYRQSFVQGDLQLDGAVTRDTLEPGETRAYLFAEGGFDVLRDYRLSFDVKLTSDDTYLREYGYSSSSRLRSSVALTRVSRDTFTRAELINFQTLREDEDNETQPGIIVDGLHYQRIHPQVGGELRLSALVHGHYRSSDEDVVGRDVYRASASALWRDSWLLTGGAQLSLQGGMAMDAVRNLQDSTSAEEDGSVAPFVAATLRYPLVASDASGARYSLEPLAQISWTGGDNLETANDESTRSEFDEGNLLALSRFTTTDRRERGYAMALGLRWGVVDPSGWRSTLSLGHILREETREDFSPSSGLSNQNSDWLIATELGNSTGLDFIGRALLDSETLEINRGEARGRWSNPIIDLSATYLLLPEDAEENRSERVSEWSFDGGYQFTRHWRASAGWNYDIAQDRSSSGDFGLEYQNECVLARFEVDQDFADSDNLDPTTTFGLTVELKGFATGGEAGGYRRQCSN